MTWNRWKDAEQETTPHEAEETLRRLAALPAPEDLTDRVHARLADAARNAAVRRGFWSHWLPARQLQFAGAAVLALAVAASTWTLHRQHSQAGQSLPAAHPAPVAPAAGGFGTAGTARVPPTLNPIKVPAPPHRKPGPGHAAGKPVTKPAKTVAATPNP